MEDYIYQVETKHPSYFLNPTRTFFSSYKAALDEIFSHYKDHYLHEKSTEYATFIVQEEHDDVIQYAPIYVRRRKPRAGIYEDDMIPEQNLYIVRRYLNKVKEPQTTAEVLPPLE